MPFDEVSLPPFISTDILRDETKEKMTAGLVAMKASKAAEVKSSAAYKNLLKGGKETQLDLAVFELLGACSIVSPNMYNISGYASNFVRKLSLNELCNILYDNPELINKEIEKIFMSEPFLFSQFFLEEIKEEAKKIVETGLLNEKQKHFKNLIKKTKDCCCYTFSVETLKGEIILCKNFIRIDGCLPIDGSSSRTVYFENIKKVISEGKVIYEKGLF